MTFNFFRSNKKENHSNIDSTESSNLSIDDLDMVKAGYDMSQDDVNQILASSDYIKTEKRQELDKMFKTEEENSTSKRR